MRNRALSTREILLLLFLVVLLVGVGYYLFFYQPLQAELADLANQSSELDGEIQVAAAKAAYMDSMQAELDEILSRPADQITEIAPYDNAKVVMSQLNGILSASEEYKLSFKDPVIEDNGTVRRNVSMEFLCKDYNSAKAITKSLSASHWRCLINSLSIATSDDGRVFLRGQEEDPDAAAEEADEDVVYDGIMSMPVTVKATIVFFESTNIT